MTNRLAYASRGPARSQAARYHSLSVGASITLLNAPRDPRSKDSKLASANSIFEITSLLPLEGSLFQYRVKDTVTGRERVVLEDQILLAS